MNPTDAAPFTVSVMTPAEMAIAIDWARREGWNPGLQDAAAFRCADPQGFLLGRLGDRPVATISAVKYGDDFGFIGLYIADGPFRGRGFGYGIWQEAMARLAGRNVGLDGVVAQQDNYRKSGFQLAYRNIRHAGRSKASPSQTRAVPVASIDFDELVRYDRRHFPAERTPFLANWVHPDHARVLAIVEGSSILGYGVIRPCHQGYKIAPLNASTPEVAEELIRALTADLPDQTEFFVDVPEPNAHAMRLAAALGMTPVFETARMYTQRTPDLPLDEVYGITSLELG